MYLSLDQLRSTVATELRTVSWLSTVRTELWSCSGSCCLCCCIVHLVHSSGHLTCHSHSHLHSYHGICHIRCIASGCSCTATPCHGINHIHLLESVHIPYHRILSSLISTLLYILRICKLAYSEISYRKSDSQEFHVQIFLDTLSYINGIGHKIEYVSANLCDPLHQQSVQDTPYPISYVIDCELLLYTCNLLY